MSNNNTTKQVIILLGPPGSGKGTQASLLAERLSLFYFETSKVLEEAWHRDPEEVIEVDGEKFPVKHEKHLWETGVLCSPPFVTYLVKEKIENLHKEDKSLVLAGSPRTMHEGEKLVPFLKDLYGQENIKVVVLELSPEQTIFRNTNRRICELMRHPILYTEDTKDLKTCPLDGSKLIKRKGLDDPESIKVRLKEYEERTFPLVEYFKEQGLEVKKVNGEQSVADVFSDILRALD